MDGLTNSLDAALRARARRVVPGGMWGHQHADRMPEGYPQFFTSGQGARVRDADGREFVDLMCAWGPMVLGHRHPEVEAAARRQADLGDCLNGPGAVMVDLAEHLVGMISHADWAQFQKNGTDATTACVTIARAGTGRRKVLVARGSYHGAAPWCTPSLAGVTAEDRAHILHYEYNDIASVQRAVAAAGADLAAILVTAFRHDVGRDQAMASPAFAHALRAACDATGAALIVDDVRAGFRLHPGGSWETVGVRPDLSAFSKAIANGYALSAITGTDQFRAAATQVYSTGSFWCGAVPMAAALTTLRVLQRDDGIARMQHLGTLLRDGLAKLAGRHGTPLRQTGPVQMPMVLFADDPEQRLGSAFCTAALRRGVYLHPRHNMFLSAAHTEADIAFVLEAADGALGDIRPLLDAHRAAASGRAALAKRGPPLLPSS
jgi:glutamate-1-semialdehyde 2,1-aminomutase